MKRKTLFKILTLFLTFVIFSCSSGCIISILDNIAEDTYEKGTQRRIEIQKERKAQADALIPEIDGYIFEALPKDAFKDQADWESKGFLNHYNFFNGNGGVSYAYEIQPNDNSYVIKLIYWKRTSDKTELIEVSKIIMDKSVYENKLDKFRDSFMINNDYTAYGSVYHYDNEYFLILEMKLYEDGMQFLSGPPAIFLLDFKNNTISYVGYAKGWLEYEIQYGKFYDRFSICFKLTKEIG